MDKLNLTVANTAVDISTGPSGTLNAEKEKFAKDFESILIQKLLEEMKNTIGEWGYEQDGAAEQTQGLFWMNLATDLGQQGGLGLWKEIYNSLESPVDNPNSNESLDDIL